MSSPRADEAWAWVLGRREEEGEKEGVMEWAGSGKLCIIEMGAPGGEVGCVVLRVAGGAEREGFCN